VVGLTLPHRVAMMFLVTLTRPGPQPISSLYPVFIITFVWAVCSERLRFSSALVRPLPSGKAVSRLVEHTILHMAPARHKRATPEEIIKLANNPPPDALVSFSNGSSIPNPGPCGAGALLILSGAAGQVLSTMALGEGDNNLGEIARSLLQWHFIGSRATPRSPATK
jgi:hypothetical protein